MEKIKFEDYVMMIRKMAHKFSNKYNVPYDEVEAQGFLIYSECVKTFDMSKGSFSTHLFTNLKKLNDYGQTYNRQKGVLLEDINNYDFRKSNNLVKIKSKEIENKSTYDICLDYNPITLVDLLQYSKEYLSNEAYKLFKWILERSWDDFIHTKPTVKMAMEKFKTTRKRIDVLWEECSNFWNNVGINYY